MFVVVFSGSPFCIYLNGWDFFFHIPIPLYSIIVNIKANIHQLTTGLLAINIFAPFALCDGCG